MPEPLGRTAAYARCGHSPEEADASLIWSSILTTFSPTCSLSDREWEREPCLARQPQRQLDHAPAKGPSNQGSCRWNKIYVGRGGAELQEFSKGDHEADGESSQSTFIDAIDSLAELLPVVWNIDADASISAACIETIDCVARTIRLFPRWLKCLSFDCKDDTLSMLPSPKILKLVSILSGDNLTVADNVQRSANDLKTIPFTSSWLTSDLTSLSVRTHNICVAPNVSLFSGWQKEQFSDRMLRGESIKYFGVDVQDVNLSQAMFLSLQKKFLEEQWKLVCELVGASLSFDFSAKLKALRDTAWYRDIRKRHQDTLEKKLKIIFYGEDHLSFVSSPELLAFVPAHRYSKQIERRREKCQQWKCKTSFHGIEHTASGLPILFERTSLGCRSRTTTHNW